MLKHIWVLFLFVSCFKTAEEIRRDQAVDQMSVQLEQSAKLVADLTQQVTELQSRLANTTGQIEEIDHYQRKSSEERSQSVAQSIAQLQTQLQALASENEQNKKSIAQLQAELKEQKQYVSRVNSSIKKLASDAQGPSLQDANKLFEANKLKEAQQAYLEVLDAGKINNAQRNAVWYNLGLIHYWNKKYDDAASYFSRIYTKWPKSSYAPRSLLYIARSFDKGGKSAEAKAAYSELISKYPDSSQAKTAKEEMK